MKHLRTFCTPVLMLLFLQTQSSNAQGAGEAVPLIYKLDKGKTYQYTARAEMQGTQTMMGMEMTYTSNVSSGFHVTVEDVDREGTMSCIAALDSIIIKVHSQRQDTTMVNPFGIVGKRTREVVSSSGKVLKSTPVDTVQAPMRMGMGSIGARAIFADYGGGAVKVGATWAHTRRDTVEQSGMKIVSTSNLTFTAVEMAERLGLDCVKISYNGTMTIEGSGSMMGMNAYTEGTGDVSGVSYFAPKEGLVVESEGTVDQEMTVALTGQQSMTIPMSQTVSSTVTLLR